MDVAVAVASVVVQVQVPFGLAQKVKVEFVAMLQ